MRKPPLHKSFGNAIRGITGMISSERNFQFHILALIINLFLIVFLELNSTDTALIFIVCFGVMSTEILNTAIEKICDFVHPEFDERIKFIKDISAGAVTLMAILAVIVGFLVYPKYLF
ncbi:diacylglycerol kinase family protein [Chryseobacterium taklimakanense]|uniref:Undecaprenol kinase n=1 Tax=Chryseobacterium taklimakanense TaxID=536441 RepID=A0A239WX59_9FLAO|nr:diacylglycerol kinase family protein [Chryseobacterium taklimakanense]SNV38294.1 Undecaprenol kinase [Chryseobacterium taklimakanense]